MSPDEAKELAIRAAEGETLLERQLAASRLLVALTQSQHTFKRCACGAAYSLPQWGQLELAGVQLYEEDEEEPRTLYESRHCRCGSTLMVQWVAP